MKSAARSTARTVSRAAAAAARSIARPDAVERLADLVELVASRQLARNGTRALA